MATSTTKLGATKPAGDEDVEIAVLNNNFDLFDTAAGATAAAAASKPASAFSGRMWFETDTGLLKVNTAASASTAAVWTSSAAGSGSSFITPTGAAGDGTTDDTTALQNWINSVTTAKAAGYLPAGTYKITAALGVPANFGWKLFGAGPEASIIRQHTNNTPILDIGASGSASIHSWEISDLQFTYQASQSTAQTNSLCIRFSQMGYEGRILRCTFKHGFRGIAMNTGIVGFWGCTLDDLWFDSGITGSAITWTGASSAGVPNNHFVRMYANAQNMAGPVFVLYGETSKVDTIEINNADQGPTLLELWSGSVMDIDQFKVEVGTWAASKTLVDIGVNANIRFGYLRFADLTVNGSSIIKCVKIGGGSGEVQTVRIGRIDAGGTFNSTSRGYILEGPIGTFGGATALQLSVDDVKKVKDGGASPNGWELQDSGSSDTATICRVNAHMRGEVSANLGNANYDFALGGPNVGVFKTTFTAQRTITLPALPNELWNGLTYKVITQGAVNGANTMLVRSNSVTLHTISTDNYAYEYTYRRVSPGDTSQNWQLTAKSNLA